MRDLHNNLKFTRAISPQSVSDNTALVSAIIDTLGYDSLEFAIITGSLADADATFTVLVEDGDNNALSDNAAVADAQLLGLETDASFIFSDDNITKKIGYRGSKRYVRLTITPAANASAALISAVAVQGHASMKPVS